MPHDILCHTAPCHYVHVTTDLETPADVPANRRERKKLETRAALERAALRLFAEKGYENTTVEEIAVEADVAVRTFFRYFSSKQHILFGEVAHDRIGRLRTELAARPTDEPILASVRAMMEAMDVADPREQEQIMLRMRLMERQPSLVRTYLWLNHQLRQIVAEFVAERTGLPVDRDTYPMVVATAVTSSWEIALRVWVATDGRRSLRALRREVFDTLTTGLGEPRRAVAGGRLGITAPGRWRLD
jgi:TetR/AcrR family transcriptional regulator, regulator of mycofactocin system